MVFSNKLCFVFLFPASLNFVFPFIRGHDSNFILSLFRCYDRLQQHRSIRRHILLHLNWEIHLDLKVSKNFILFSVRVYMWVSISMFTRAIFCLVHVNKQQKSSSNSTNIIIITTDINTIAISEFLFLLETMVTVTQILINNNKQIVCVDVPLCEAGLWIQFAFTGDG